MLDQNLISRISIKEQVNKRIKAIEEDDRFNQPPALVQVNAPLALIQIGLDVELVTYKWFLKILDKEYPTDDDMKEYRNDYK